MESTEKNASNNSYTVLCVLIAVVTFLQSRCPVPIGDTHTETQMGVIAYAVSMGSGVKIYTQSHIKIGSGIQKLTGRIHSLLFIFSK
jgi:hypothetical protein